MSSIHYSLNAMQIVNEYAKDSLVQLNEHPSLYQTNVLKKEEQEYKSKDYNVDIRFRVWRDIMNNDNLKQYPNAEENLLSDILGDDTDIKNELEMS